MDGEEKDRGALLGLAERMTKYSIVIAEVNLGHSTIYVM